jgi:pyruvoyl-dependent arginine decarboxylase (PvlArgDC)
VVDGANTSIGIAFADNEPINGVLSEAKKEKQNARNRQHSRRLVAES